MTRNFAPPILGHGPTAEEQSEEVADKIARNEEHACVGGVAESSVDTEYTVIEEKDGDLISQEANYING